MSRTQYAFLDRTTLPNTSVFPHVYTAFDFETTGLDYRTDRITEIGAVKFTMKGVIDEFSCLINPKCSISEEAVRITGITNDMLVNEPLIAEKIPDFFDFIGDSYLMAHHAPFDVSFLQEACLAAEAPLPSNIILDTRLIAKNIFPKQTGYSLERLIAFLEITSPRHHRALDDAHSCMNIFLECVKKGGPGITLRKLYPAGFILHN